MGKVVETDVLFESVYVLPIDTGVVLVVYTVLAAF